MLHIQKRHTVVYCRIAYIVVGDVRVA